MHSSLTALLLFAAIAFSTTTTAQITSGTIDYIEHRSFDFGDWMSLDRKKEMEARMAAGDFDQTGQVSFNENEFSYQQLPIDESKIKDRRSSWMARMGENPEIFYVNIQDSLRTDRRRIMDQAFILNEPWVAPKWNIAKMNVSMKELPLPNRFATAITETGDTLTAYFTESIPLSIGPKGYGGLPGAILYLKVQSEGNAVEYTMSTMQPNAPDLVIAKPDDAKEISREKFDKEMKRAKEAQERQMRSWRRN